MVFEDHGSLERLRMLSNRSGVLTTSSSSDLKCQQDQMAANLRCSEGDLRHDARALQHGNGHDFLI